MTLSIFTSRLQSTPIPTPIIGDKSSGINGFRKRKEAGNYWLVTGEKVAVKIISKSYLASNATTERAVKREIAIMKLIQHPHIMRLIDVIDVQDSPNLYLVLEYVPGGELFEYLINHGRLSEVDARKHFQQIIFAMDFCHRHLICHRDLKPENLLLDESSNIKIADFGMASLQPRGTLLETSCGSPHYASPEIVSGIPYNGTASDIWSCGVILYALLCGHLPFDDTNIRELLYKVKRGKYTLPKFLSNPAKDLIQKILVVHPDKRLTMQQIQDHEWFKMDGIPVNPTLAPSFSGTDQIIKPIKDISAIDDRLLESLQTLWMDRSKEQLIDALMNQEYNMEKVAYTLLQRHSTYYWQTKHDDDDDDNEGSHISTYSSRNLTKPRGRRPITICGPQVSSIKSALPNLHQGNEIDKIISPPSPGVQRNFLQRKHTIDSSLYPIRSPNSTQPKRSLWNRNKSYQQVDNHCQQVDTSKYHYKTPQRHSSVTTRKNRYTMSTHRSTASTSATENIFDSYFLSSKAERRTLKTRYSSSVGIHLDKDKQELKSPSVIQCQQQRMSHQQRLHQIYGMDHSIEQPQQSTYPILSPATSTPRSDTRSRIQRLSQHMSRRTGSFGFPTLSSQDSTTSIISPKLRKAKNRLSAPLFMHSLFSSNYRDNNSNSIPQDNNICSIDQLLQQQYPDYQKQQQQQQQHHHHQQQQQQQQKHSRQSLHSPGIHESRPSHPLMCSTSPLLTSKPRVAPSSPLLKAPMFDSPRLSSWLPALLHFKQPKVCTINCIAKDEKEAFGKIAQVIREHMNGSFVESKDINGKIKRKGYIECRSLLTTGSSIFHQHGSRKHHLVRFKLEKDQEQLLNPFMLSQDKTQRLVKINFIQQQGDTIEFINAVKMVEKVLNDYEKEAEYVVSANGWSMTTRR
ncbi:uncharacterized protein BX664DRAFT_377459 [Halteromyces radiatus]|uniref:uncharacterized protein n=1 Tax=Halteromyces radiatus TaxID=101107 RepID=UPI00221E79AF|nr:uncharacterized protein BX664DRAFT_377459 [Halteromyces radiatus]KAI8099714.1 hypothetical protein BX664DRAFT_377459 [Halteromyces radiatus]